MAEDYKSDDTEEEYVLYNVLVNEISSISFDSCSPSERNEVEREVHDLIEEEEIRLELIDLGDDIVNKCSSKHSFERILKIYSKAIALELHENSDNTSIIDLLRIECKLLERLSCDSVEMDLKGIKSCWMSSPVKVDLTRLKEVVWWVLSENELVASACGLLSIVDSMYKRKEVIVLMLKHLISTLASRGNVYLCKKYLETITCEEWNENEVSSALSSKMKSKPESSLEFMQAFFEVACVPDGVEIHEDWVLFGIKQIKSMKNVELAEQLLCHLPSKAPVITNIVSACKKKQFCQWKQRKAAYDVIAKRAKAEAITELLTDLTSIVAQEDKMSIDTELSCKQSALSALISLWRLTLPKHPGYKSSVEFFASSDSKSFRFRFLLLFNEELDHDRIALYITDMFQSSSFKPSTLESYIDNASKKLCSSTSLGTSLLLPHFIDGIFAMYLLLLNNKPPSPQLSKVLSNSKSSFLCTSFTMDILTSAQDNHSILCDIISRCILLYCKYLTKTDATSILLKLFQGSGDYTISTVLATCIVGNKSCLETLSKIISYVPSAIPSLVNALYTTVNNLSLYNTNLITTSNATRKNREEYLPIMEDGNTTPFQEKKYSLANVRNSIKLFIELDNNKEDSYCAQMAILLHVGTTIATSSTKRQRTASINYLGTVLEKYPSIIQSDSINHILSFNTSQDVSKDIKNAVISLISSLSIHTGDNYDPDEDETSSAEWNSCTTILPTLLANQLSSFTKQINTLSIDDIHMYRHDPATLYIADDAEPTNTTKSTKKTKSEEEQWEEEIRKELEAKKQKDNDLQLSKEDIVLLEQQQKQRQTIKALFTNFEFICSIISSLCNSHIMVGNACIPTLYTPIMESVMTLTNEKYQSIQLGKHALHCLSSLTSSIYELEDGWETKLVNTLLLIYQIDQESLEIKPLLPPLPNDIPLLLQSIQDSYHAPMDTYSKQSFTLIYPLLQSMLIGPRSPFTYCEEIVLKILGDHVSVMMQDDKTCSGQWRRDFASLLLEFLLHDRSTSYHSTSIKILTDVYDMNDTDKITPSEMVPLLNEIGLLSSNAKNRLASLQAVDKILGSLQNPASVKNDTLVENRVWINCFSSDESVREEARNVWKTFRDNQPSNLKLAAPSKLYAFPLFPLLSHSHAIIAKSAASAFSYGMCIHVDGMEGNVLKLCEKYIESFPVIDTASTPSIPKKPISASISSSKKKPSNSLSALKTKPKKPEKTSSLLAAGTKTTSSSKKKSSKTKPVSASLLLPKKEERTIDEENMLSLSTATSKKKNPEEEDTESKQRVRQGVLTTMLSLSSISTTENESIDIPVAVLQIIIQFLMSYGLSDPNLPIRSFASDTARDLIASFGGQKQSLDFLVPFLESVLASGQVTQKDLVFSMGKIDKSIEASDFRKEGVVTSLGSVALHLFSSDEYQSKIMDILSMLHKSLHTPSEDVQHSSAQCLSKLVTKMKNKPMYQDRIDELITKTLQDSLDTNSSLAVRRGGAYGFAALIKGMGISALKKYSVVSKLDEALNNASSAATKEGALFCIELLSRNLKLLFEPYVITLLPALLNCFGDVNDHVRNAANQSTSTIMSQLSAHGIKLVMPAVLSGLEGTDDTSWRTKVACIRMLGSMSHCAPKQLASCLPKAVPKLIDSFSDTHPKVKNASLSALEELTTVVRNPEIRTISSTLLNALVDPAHGTLTALETMIHTEFLHSMDAPSLALVCPILHRGLRDRAALTKRYAALIAGNICTMIAEARDFYPYQDMLLTDIQYVLLDPIPDVRSTAAKAIGSLTRGLGEDKMPDLRQWLLDTLCGDLGSVERSGAAQGLAELIMASGTEMVEEVMLGELLPLLTSHHPSVNTREGILWLMTFLPSGMGQAYSSLISPSLPALIIGLSDDNDQVRDVALRAGRVLIRNHGRAHVDKILPSLESGLEDDNTRIRLSSLLLLGDLLSLIGNTKVTATDSTNTQEDIRNAEKAQSHIALVLGKDTRCRILAGLFLARSDSSGSVRQNALQVWKSVVSVTARTLKEILPYLLDNIVSTLGHDNVERTEVAGRCLGDIVVKLGDGNVIPEVVPVLGKEYRSGDVYTRRGVCIGLAYVIDSSSREVIIKYSSTILPVVKNLLCDNDTSVRAMAATPCFHNLYSKIGMRALEELVPSLLVSMDARALNGLTGILSVRSRELLPYLIPKLLSKPLTQSNIAALGSVAKVTPNTIYSFFGSIIPTLILELASGSSDAEMKDTIRTCLQLISKHVDTDGVNSLISEVTSKTNSDKVTVRVESCWMLGIIAEERKEQADYYEQTALMYRDLLYRLNDDDKDVLLAANSTLAKLAQCVPAEELVNHLEFVKNLLASIVSDSRRRKGGVGDGEFLLPGLNIPKGLEPLLPMYQRGILFGSPALREVAALGLSDLLSITSSKFLPPALMIKITGPLLRVVGDRNPPAVKIAIVQILGLILTKGGMALRAFVPQFQTTFLKSLSDPSRQVRVEAIKALGLLMPLSTRLDPLIKELVASSLGKSSIDSETAAAVAVQTAALEALAIVLKNGGTKAKLPESISSAMDAGLNMLFHEDDGIREAAAKVIGRSYELCKGENASLQDKVLQETIYPNHESSSCIMKHGVAWAIYRILSSSATSALSQADKQELTKIITTLINDENAIVRSAACVAIGAAIGRATSSDEVTSIEQCILSKMNDSTEDIDVQCSLAKGLCVAVTMKKDIFPCSGKTLVLDAALKLSMSSVQKVQLSFNDFLWLALNVGGDSALDAESGTSILDEYISSASYENGKAMKNLASKVLSRIKAVSLDD